MASSDGDIAATRLAHEGEGSTSAKERFQVRWSVPHWDVSEYRRSYLSMLDVTCFEPMFRDGRSLTMLDRMGVRRESDVSTRI